MMNDEERARAFVDAQKWIFAKTMADIPHFYCLKKNCPAPAEFEWFVRYLVAYSVPGTFFGKTYQYLFLGNWKYWIMDANPSECDLINREFQSNKDDMKKEMVSCGWDMIQDEIPLDDLKVMGVRGAIRRGATKAEALAKYGLSETYYDQNYKRVMES